jgi:predicted P-loop ATPase
MAEHPAFPKIWRNLDTNRVMVGEKPATPDLTEMDIANYFQYNLGFEKVTNRIVYSVIQAMAKRNSRSPMLDSIKGVDWDGIERLDTWMHRLWGVRDSEFTREVAAKWLISSCARMDRPGCKVDWMMIVVGAQGTGKTSMPGILFHGNALTLYGEHNDKDLHMLLHSALCVGFDELDSFGKRESSNLKAMITRTEDAFRPPYGASVEVFPRRFTLYGCGNRYEFLQHDPSGYRRYAIVEVDRLLDFKGLEREREQLWAEAWQRYSEGRERWWEVVNASEEAKRFVVANPMEDMISNWIRMQSRSKSSAAVVDDHLHFTMTQLLSGIGMDRDVRNTQVTREVAAILRGLGAEQGNTRREVVPGVSGRYYKIPVED